MKNDKIIFMINKEDKKALKRVAEARGQTLTKLIEREIEKFYKKGNRYPDVSTNN